MRNLMAAKILSSLVLLAMTALHVEAEGHAHSFQHFHGPVAGDDHEVTWKDQHGHQHQDFSAQPSYEFAYGVEDHHTGDYHGQKEHRDGDRVVGEYTVMEPGGNVRIVRYHADHDGFHAQVHNTRGSDHHGKEEQDDR
ncbi:cuticle protein 19-like [Orussus abietinus]|uniref:cuticle protein 19-like n=1 Tax=Orussus abietinus TaxID=222816 RepID=UPI0006268333|nr:cuticle protein 19-like [Orussus abietinus]